MMLQKKGVPIVKVAGDDDHTGINRVHQQGNTKIQKESDKNHVQKILLRNCTVYRGHTRVLHKKLSLLLQKTLITCCSRIVVNQKISQAWFKGSS